MLVPPEVGVNEMTVGVWPEEPLPIVIVLFISVTPDKGLTLASSTIAFARLIFAEPLTPVFAVKLSVASTPLFAGGAMDVPGEAVTY